MKSNIISLAATLGLVITAQAGTITIINGDFEANGTSKIQTGYDTVIGWNNSIELLPDGTNNNNCGGVEYKADGIESMVANPRGEVTDINGNTASLGVYQVLGDLSAYTDLGVGSELTLTFNYGSVWSATNKAIYVNIFLTDDNGSTQNKLNEYTGSTGNTNTSTTWVFGQTLTYTLTDTDMVAIADGAKLGIAFGAGEITQWVGFDDFSLTYTPIPEPSTYALIGAGIALGFVALHRRRKQRPNS